MIGAGTVINPIVKIVTTVAILGAVYLFVIKPTLDTTNNITNRAFDTSDRIQEDIQNSLQDSGINGNSVKIPKEAQRAQKMGDCMQKNIGDATAVQACADKFGP